MQSEGSRHQQLFAELKRRKVFRVMAVYGVVAFAILQVADIAFPLLSLPEWTVTFVLALSLVGFPIAIVLAWGVKTLVGRDSCPCRHRRTGLGRLVRGPSVFG